MERLVEYLFVVRYPDPVSLLSPQQRQQRFRFELLGSKTRKQSHDR